ncbi:MAG: metallophosphoesterase [Chloroflexi bacterium]|nr:metallophosphoesterase [Chloroflexota bacterium]
MKSWIAGAMAAAAGVGAFVALYARFIERTQIRLDRFTVRVDKPGLPPGGLTILHLSDLHCRATDPVQTRKLARLERLLTGEQYDLLAVTGDLITDTAGLDASLAFLATLRPRLGGFFCPGNRDYWESGFQALFARAEPGATPLRWTDAHEIARRLRTYSRKILHNERTFLRVLRNDTTSMRAGLQTIGMRPLINAVVHLEADGLDLWIAGVDDLTGGEPDLAAALSGVPNAAPLLLLAHNPDIWLDPLADRADLILAGHTHGGQVRLPLVGALYVQGTHLSRRRPAGWFERGTTRMFVTRGVGESFRWRLGAQPQAALIRVV